MSAFKAEVIRVKLKPHPNADRLELAKVRGWQCCVVKGQFQEGGLNSKVSFHRGRRTFGAGNL